MDTHGIVLFFIASAPDRTQRQISEALGLTERRIAHVVRDLVEADMLRITKVGSRNQYAVNAAATFRHPSLSHITLGQFLRILHEEIDVGVRHGFTSDGPPPSHKSSDTIT